MSADKDVYQTIGKLQLLGWAYNTIKSFLPTSVQGLQVTVAGGPKSHIRRLWYLCLSAAFGRYRDRISSAVDGDLMMESRWDISNKIVSLEIVTVFNGWGTVEKLALAGRMNLPSASVLGRMARGPEQVTVGGSWPFDLLGPKGTNPNGWTQVVNKPEWIIPMPCPGATFTNSTPVPYTGIGGARNIGTGQEHTALSTTPPIPDILVEYPDFNGSPVGSATGIVYSAATNYPFWGAGPLSGSAGSETVWQQGIEPDNGCTVVSQSLTVFLPTLPDDGRVITTVEQNDPSTQPPRPIIDGHTRSGLLSLVAQGLSTPCFLPVSAPCTPTPQASSGYYVYAPGTNNGSDSADQILISQNKEQTQLYDLDANIGPDGYVTQPINAGAPNGSAINLGE